MKVLDILQGLRSIVNIKNLRTLLKIKWVVFGIGPFIFIIGILFVIGIGRWLTTYPPICLSCHAKQSALPMWEPSKVHSPKVTCVDCHAKPGELFPRFFFADERMNDNCLICHKAIPMKEMEETSPIKINHKLHHEEAKLMCIDCHRNIAHEKFEEGTNRPKKLTCGECHKEDLTGGPEACMKCHTKNPGKI